MLYWYYVLINNAYSITNKGIAYVVVERKIGMVQQERD